MANETHAREEACQVSNHSGNKMLQLFNVSVDFFYLPWQPGNRNLSNQSCSPEDLSPSHYRWLIPQSYPF